jgi:hypothetical protein
LFNKKNGCKVVSECLCYPCPSPAISAPPLQLYSLSSFPLEKGGGVPQIEFFTKHCLEHCFLEKYIVLNMGAGRCLGPKGNGVSLGERGEGGGQPTRMQGIYGVRSETKCSRQIKQKRFKVSKMYFLTFFVVYNADTNALFAAVLPPLQGPGEVVFGERPDDPLPLRLELVQGHGEPHQLSLQCGEEEIVRWCQVR